MFPKANAAEVTRRHGANESLGVNIPEIISEQIARCARKSSADNQTRAVLLPADPEVVGPMRDRGLHGLPLESLGWCEEITPTHIPVIRYTQPEAGKGRFLSVDSGVRPLIICTHRAVKLGDVRSALGEKIAPFVHEAHSKEEVTSRLSESSDVNVLILMSHLKGSRSSDQRAVFDFAGPHPDGAEVMPAGTLSEELADVVAAHKNIRVVILLACSTWSLAADKFIEAGIPVVIGTHRDIAFDRENLNRWLKGIGSFIGTLEATGRIDDAFAMLRADVDGGTPGVQASTLAMHAFLSRDYSLQFVADPALTPAIDYARHLRRSSAGIKPADELRSNSGESADERFRRHSAYLERHLLQQIKLPAKERGRGDGALSEDAAGTPGEGSRTQDVATTQERLLEILRQTTRGRFGLRAPWGMGKTMLMRWIAHTLAEQYLQDPRENSVLPVYIELWRLRDAVGTNTAIWPEHIWGAAMQSCRADSGLAKRMKDSSARRCLFLLDGLDEAKGLEGFLNAAQQTDGGPFWAHSTIISSRPEAVPSSNALANFGDEAAAAGSIFTIEPFSRPDIRRYIEMFFEDNDNTRDHVLRMTGVNGGDAAAASSLGSALSTPYLLHLYCQVVEEDLRPGAGELHAMSTAVEVLQRALPMAIARRLVPHNIEQGRTMAKALIWPLARLAFESRLRESRLWSQQAESQWRGVNEVDALAAVRDVLEVMKKTNEHLPLQMSGTEVTAAQVLPMLLDHSGVLRRRAGTHVEVHDARYADFLPALWLARLVQGPFDVDVLDDAMQFPAQNSLRYLAQRESLIPGWDNGCINDLLEDRTTGNMNNRTETVRQFIGRKVWDEPNWSLPIELLAGLLEDPSPMLNDLSME